MAINIKSEDLKIAFADEGITLLKSDNICLGGKIPLPGGVGIVVEETEPFPKGAADRQEGS
ncbi:MAG: hypothetical protein HDR24_00250 [Lachnospiraceae bacterium]|nr:hypothetical protein [Lachnospiraceae bacterium]